MGPINKKAVIIFLLVCLVILISLDYRRKRHEFNSLKREYDLTISFEQPATILGNYFDEFGYYPETLSDADTLFNTKPFWKDFDDYRETPYRFLIDPFSRDYFLYIPIRSDGNAKPDSYYLLSAGIDSKFNNKVSNVQMFLYDSLTFSYLDFYFGKKDLLVSKASTSERKARFKRVN